MATDARQYQRKHLADGAFLAEAMGAVPKPGESRIAAGLEALSAVHDWWGRPLTLEEAGGSGHLVLEANLTLIGYELEDGELVDVEPEDDAFMAWMDLCVIVDWLAEQSAATGSSWRLSFGGEGIGSVAEGEEDEALGAFVVALGERVGARFDESDDRRAEALDEAHRERMLE